MSEDTEVGSRPASILFLIGYANDATTFITTGSDEAQVGNYADISLDCINR